MIPQNAFMSRALPGAGAAMPVGGGGVATPMPVQGGMPPQRLMGAPPVGGGPIATPIARAPMAPPVMPGGPVAAPMPAPNAMQPGSFANNFMRARMLGASTM